MNKFVQRNQKANKNNLKCVLNISKSSTSICSINLNMNLKQFVPIIKDVNGPLPYLQFLARMFLKLILIYRNIDGKIKLQSKFKSMYQIIVHAI